MIYLVILLIILICYYTLTYGINVWKKEKNTMGGFAVMTLAVMTTITSIIFIIIRA